MYFIERYEHEIEKYASLENIAWIVLDLPAHTHTNCNKATIFYNYNLLLVPYIIIKK